MWRTAHDERTQRMHTSRRTHLAFWTRALYMCYNKSNSPRDFLVPSYARVRKGTPHVRKGTQCNTCDQREGFIYTLTQHWLCWIPTHQVVPQAHSGGTRAERWCGLNNSHEPFAREAWCIGSPQASQLRNYTISVKHAALHSPETSRNAVRKTRRLRH